VRDGHPANTAAPCCAALNRFTGFFIYGSSRARARCDRCLSLRRTRRADEQFNLLHAFPATAPFADQHLLPHRKLPTGEWVPDKAH
jgi:hypothetical protein